MKFSPLAVVPRGIPPVLVVYHFIELPWDIAFRFEDAPAQTEAGEAVTWEGGDGERFIVISDKSGALVIAGLPDTTLILYWVPDDVRDGIEASIIPEFTETRLPMLTGEEKLPEASLN